MEQDWMGIPEEYIQQEYSFMYFYLQVLNQGWKQVLSFCWSFKTETNWLWCVLQAKEFSSALASSLCSTVVSKASDNANRTIYTSVHKTF